MNYLAALKEYSEYFGVSGTVPDAKFVNCYFELFLGEAATKNLKKMKSVVLLLEPDCVTDGR
jgi:hypothetical protein